MEGTQFKASAGSLLKDSSLADFEIKCGSDTYQVHRVILACHSQYFKTLFEGQFSESSKRSIELHENNPNAVKLMIDYFYRFDYEDAHDKITGFSNPLELNAAVYIVAAKYDVPDMKKLAVKHFTRAAPQSAIRHESPVEAIRLVFTGTTHTDRVLRDVVLEYWTTFANVLIDGQGSTITRRVVDCVPEFATELFNKSAETQGLKFEANCTQVYTGGLHRHASISANSIKEVFTQNCDVCGEPMATHKLLKAYHQSGKLHAVLGPCVGLITLSPEQRMIMLLQRQRLAKPRRYEVKIATKIDTQTQNPNRSNAAVMVDHTCFP